MIRSRAEDFGSKIKNPMIKYIFGAVLMMLTLHLSAQNFSSAFRQAFAENNIEKQLRILTDWEKSTPSDPELYTSYFNYYFSMSRKEVVSVDRTAPKGESLELKDKDGNTAGYMGSQMTFDRDLTKKGLDYIDKGIAKFPDRLDMRFGKIYALGLVREYDKFTDEIVATINHSDVNKNKWKWTNNSDLPDAKEYMLSSIQNYQMELYNTEDDALIDNMERIASTVLKYYPDDVRSLSNISVVFMIRKDHEKALDYLKRAEKLNPKDPIVLGNMAEAYKIKGDDRNSQRYMEMSRRYQQEQKGKR